MNAVTKPGPFGRNRIMSALSEQAGGQCEGQKCWRDDSEDGRRHPALLTGGRQDGANEALQSRRSFAILPHPLSASHLSGALSFFTVSLSLSLALLSSLPFSSGYPENLLYCMSAWLRLLFQGELFKKSAPHSGIPSQPHHHTWRQRNWHLSKKNPTILECLKIPILFMLSE